MKASIDGIVIAEAPEAELISIEGNYYFPPSSLSTEAFSDSATPYTCPWKGVARECPTNCVGIRSRKEIDVEHNSQQVG